MSAISNFFTDVARLFYAYTKWLASFRRIWIALAVVVSVGAICAFIPVRPEDQVRYYGLILQLLGVSTVVMMLSDKTETFGRLGLWGFLRARFAARPKFRPPSQTIVMPGAAASIHAGSLHPSVWYKPSPTATLDERVHHLEQNIETLRVDLEWHAQQLRQSNAQLQADLESERAERRSTVAAVEVRLERLGVGGLHIEATGLFWLVLGIICATIPLELAKLFGLQ